MVTKKTNPVEIVQPPEPTPQSITREMQQSYLDYAMSVIVARALPDVRDGLKPVHRRILYAMWEMGLRANAKFKKSAAVVGEVLGKYHPHGDTAVYDAMVRMAQDFSMRYQLVRGQGNFGSMDGDGAAAMRYTEVKLASIAELLLSDIDEDTVPFAPNYDGSQQEPRVLPALLPNLLLNGTVGIAVGMATSIPPHNLGELVDGIVHIIDNPECSIDELCQFVKGPDFPTGGYIFNSEDIRMTYLTGKGRIISRGKAEIVEDKPGQFKIIISQLPYQVNKSNFVEKIAELVHEKKIEGIKDLRDESDKDGVRVVVELKKDAYPKKILNSLYKLTQLQEAVHVNMLALVDSIQPRILDLKSALVEYIKHRQDVVTRRTQFRLIKAEDRAHILEGLLMALEDIDRIITIIKKSKDRDEAKKNLIDKFKFSERQTIAILEMRLQQLVNLEKLKVEEELDEKKKTIKELKSILESKEKLMKVIKTEALRLKELFADERRTQIIPHAADSISIEDLIPDEPTVVVMTRDGYIKRLAPDTFRVQGRGGMGVIGLTTKEEDGVERIFSTRTHADLLFFTSAGKCYALKAYDVPQGSRTSKGQAIINFLQLAHGERVTAVLSSKELAGEEKYLAMVTAQGTIKKTEFSEFNNVRRNGLIAINLDDGDSLQWVRPTSGNDDILLVTLKGQSIRFPESEVRAMGRQAAGVRGIKLEKGDAVVGMDIVEGGKPGNDSQVLVVMAHGYGKRTPTKEFRTQGRGGSGIKVANVTDKTGDVSAAFIVNAKLGKEDLMIMSAMGQMIRFPLEEVPVLGRDTQGVKVMRFRESEDTVGTVTFV